MNNVPRVIAGLLCALTLPLPLQGAEWNVPLPPAGAVTPLVERVLPAGSGYRLVAADDEGRTLWAETAGGALRWQRPAQAGLGGLALQRARLSETGGGATITTALAGDACRWARLAGDGALLALAAADDCIGDSVSYDPFRIQQPLPDAAGESWLAIPNTATAIRLGADGESQAATLPADATAAFAFTPLRRAAGAYALYRRGEVLAVARVDARGHVWSWRPEGDDVHVLALQTAGNDDLWVVGKVGSRTGAGELYVARVSPQGETRWQRRYPDVARALIVQTQALPGDRLAIATLPALDAQRHVYVLGVDGGTVADLPPRGDAIWAGFVEQPVDAAARPAGPFALFLGPTRADGGSPDPAQINAIDYRDAEGRRIALLPTLGRGEDLSLTRLLDDGSLVHVDSDRANRRQTLRHYGVDGQPRAAPALQGSLVPSARALASHVAADGETFVLFAASEQTPLRLAAYTAGGQLRWITELSRASARFVTTPSEHQSSQRPQFASNAERVCVGPMRTRFSQVFVTLTRVASAVNCLRREDGGLLFSLDTVPDQVGDLLPAIALTADNDTLLLEAACVECGNPRQLEGITLDPLGAVKERRALLAEAESFYGRRRSGVIDGVDAVATLRADGSGEAVYSNARRELVFQPLPGFARAVVPRRTLAVAPDGVLLAQQLLADDVLLVHSWQNGVHRLEAYDANSRLRWQRDVAGPLDGPDGESPLLFAAAGDRVLTTEQGVSAGRRAGALRGLDARSGTQRWLHPLSAVDGRKPLALRIDPEGERLLLLSDRPGALLLRTLDLSDGRERGLRRMDCAAPDCAGAALHVAADGDARIVATRQLARVDLAAAERAAPLRQAALRGTWFDPATDGQGLLIDLSPSSGDLLAAWFTYAGGETLGVSGLAWYTLAGEAAANATRTTLTLFRNAEGRFDAPPVTESVAVGEVDLVLRGCNALQLDYRFSAGEFDGLTGTTVLQRLSPSASDCVDADGRTVAASAPSTNAAASARSGAWFAPESAGQGLLFDLRPASADGSDPGLLLGGWFTYDPDGAADDPAAQHWFQLQGTPEDAGGNRQRGQIFRASNGALDARPTRNVHAVGEVSLQFEGCERARLDYRFDDSGLAGSVAGRRGSIALIKLLPCEP